ncbi:hypothetical protein Ddye_012306 [Dipteronia dyeriana]|uniref:Uncharacterized protein n=1 Tax=Dipteronia dyeriana TaxID=168575 RepID=A0AAE0CIG5_9ROSI|nr:hypothetical protein Ddye_012306 [Dipteronia dyeriana]
MQVALRLQVDFCDFQVILSGRSVWSQMHSNDFCKFFLRLPSSRKIWATSVRLFCDLDFETLSHIILSIEVAGSSGGDLRVDAARWSQQIKLEPSAFNGGSGRERTSVFDVQKGRMATGRSQAGVLNGEWSEKLSGLDQALPKTLRFINDVASARAFGL